MALNYHGFSAITEGGVEFGTVQKPFVSDFHLLPNYLYIALSFSSPAPRLHVWFNWLGRCAPTKGFHLHFLAILFDFCVS
jgi:hypothetical protein